MLQAVGHFEIGDGRAMIEEPPTCPGAASDQQPRADHEAERDAARDRHRFGGEVRVTAADNDALVPGGGLPPRKGREVHDNKSSEDDPFEMAATPQGWGVGLMSHERILSARAGRRSILPWE